LSIKVENLTMQYLYGREAVTNLSFECKDDERIAVLATSEGGKTSLLKCIAGLFPAAKGEIFIGEKQVTRLKPKMRDTVMIYEDGGVIKGKSVRFHLEYPLKLRKINKAERKRRVLEVSKEFGLYPMLTDITRMLYTDDIIRLSFARAALRDAEVYLIDDPFKKLSGAVREELFQEMLPHIRALKGSVVFATSSLDEAFSVADKVIVLNFGKHEQTGTPEELTSQPSSLTVDRLVNPRNARVECAVLTDDSGAFITLLQKRIALPSEYAGRDITASFAIKEGSNGESFAPISHGYLGGRKYVLFPNGGTLFTDEPIKNAYSVATHGKVHIFDNLSEKRLTSII